MDMGRGGAGLGAAIARRHLDRREAQRRDDDARQLREMLARAQAGLAARQDIHVRLEDGRRVTIDFTTGLASVGETVEIPSREVEIHRITLLKAEADRALFEVECGKGTYVRSLARDMGELLGCHGHVSQLRRTEVGVVFQHGQLVPELSAEENVALPERTSRPKRTKPRAEALWQP